MSTIDNETPYVVYLIVNSLFNVEHIFTSNLEHKSIYTPPKTFLLIDAN